MALKVYEGWVRAADSIIDEREESVPVHDSFDIVHYASLPTIGNITVNDFHFAINGCLKEGKEYLVFNVQSSRLILGSSIYFLINYIRAIDKTNITRYAILHSAGEIDVRKADFMGKVERHLSNIDQSVMLPLSEEDSLFILFRRNEEGNYYVYLIANTYNEALADAGSVSVEELKRRTRDILLMCAIFYCQDHNLYVREATIRTALEEHITTYPTKLVWEYLE